MDAASASVTSLDQLEAMLAEGRISDDDYSVLRQAFDSGPRRSMAPMEPMAKPSKRWGKSWKNQQLGGVCGGIAEAMELNPWTLRLVFIAAFLFSGGSAFLVYVLLYIVLPWKEDEEHLVWRIPVAFVLTTFGLWSVLFILNLRTAPLLVGTFEKRDLALPVVWQWLLQAQQFLTTGTGIFVQLGAISVACILYGIAPREGTARRAIFWSVCGGLLVLLAAAFMVQLSILYPYAR
ncbi:MAG: PspC domain-containing protein [Candidatus Hydrogenedentales bacterium]|jgi:phage shock protein C